MPVLGNHEYMNSDDPSIKSRPYFDYLSAKNGFQPPAAPVPNDPDNDHGLTSFTFSSTEPSNATFQTRLDGGHWEANGTATSKTYSGLANGTHTFEVKATDAAGNTDPTPASRS